MTNRENLIAALRELQDASAAWIVRDRQDAFRRAIEAFDAEAARVVPSGSLSPEVIERLRTSVRFAAEKRFLAVSIDLGDLLSLLALFDAPPLAAESQAVAELSTQAAA